MPDEWIRQWGDPTLREVAAPVTGVDEIMRMQVKRMKRHLLDAEGAGLAATQVGLMRRLFVFRRSIDSEVEVLVNPAVVDRSAEYSGFLEGCLSFRDVLVLVHRPAAVRVEGVDLDGHRLLLDVEGYEASLLQHEIDHLDGVLTLDRADPAERSRAISELMSSARGQSALAA